MAPSRRSVLRRSLGVAALVSLVTLAGCASDDPATTPASSTTERTTSAAETTRAATTVLTETPTVAYDDLTSGERSAFDRALDAGGRLSGSAGDRRVRVLTVSPVE